MGKNYGRLVTIAVDHQALVTVPKNLPSKVKQ